MSLSLQQMRFKIGEAYDSVHWKDRVRRMPANQVAAIYKTMLNRGQFDKKKQPKNHVKEVYRQMTIFDYI